MTLPGSLTELCCSGLHTYAVCKADTARLVSSTGYAFLLAPNQTPFRDQLFLEKLVGINPGSTANVGVVFFNLFNIMGECAGWYAICRVSHVHFGSMRNPTSDT
jgi:hypothetical protein